MTGLLSRLALPLLVKELTERAARRRTYVIRVIFAAFLMVVFGYLLSVSAMRSGRGPLQVLGSGQWMFQALIVFQLFGIFFFLPAMTAGQLTLEKERDSLALLFLTRLGPWQIVLQKYLGALVPILSLLCAAMPLAAIAYAYGGVTQAAIGNGTYLLTLTALQVAAFSLMCSAWCRTTVAAYISTYLLGTLVYILPPLAHELIDSIDDPWFPSLLERAKLFAKWCETVFPPAIDSFSGRILPVERLLERSVPAWISILLFLGCARLFLVRRAFVQGANPALIFFRRIDQLMQRLNQAVGGIRFGKNDANLPGANPIAWREMRRNVLARPHYLVRMLMLVEVPTIGFGLIILGNSDVSKLPIIIAGLGTLAVLVISVNAANAVVSERVQQTLEILLSTPLSAAQIVREKAVALRRLLYVAAVPLLTLVLLEWGMRLMESNVWENVPSFLSRRHQNWETLTLYLVCSLLTIAIYLPLVSWLSLWIGLKVKTRFRAILTALVTILIWSILPLFIGIFGQIHSRGSGSDEAWGWVMSCSPLFIPILNEAKEFGELGSAAPWLPVLASFACYGFVLYLIRRRCLRHADFYLRGS